MKALLVNPTEADYAVCVPTQSLSCRTSLAVVARMTLPQARPICGGVKMKLTKILADQERSGFSLTTFAGPLAAIRTPIMIMNDPSLKLARLNKASKQTYLEVDLSWSNELFRRRGTECYVSLAGHDYGRPAAGFGPQRKLRDDKRFKPGRCGEFVLDRPAENILSQSLCRSWYGFHLFPPISQI